MALYLVSNQRERNLSCARYNGQSHTKQSAGNTGGDAAREMKGKAKAKRKMNAGT